MTIHQPTQDTLGQSSGGVRTPRALLLSAALAPAGCSSNSQTDHSGGEANLQLPDLSQAHFFGLSGRTLLMFGLLVCAAGIAFGIATFSQLRRMPVHQSMREISELIYATCKAYLVQQARFLMVLWVFIATVIFVYFLALMHMPLWRVLVVLLFSLVGMAGSFGIAWFGIRVNTFANSRSAHASLAGKPYPTFDIPMRSGMSVGMVLISVELFMMHVHHALPAGQSGGQLLHWLRHR